MKRPLLAWLVTAASACALAQGSDRPLTCDRGADDSLRPVVFGSDQATSYSEAERACWLDWPAARKNVLSVSLIIILRSRQVCIRQG